MNITKGNLDYTIRKYTLNADISMCQHATFAILFVSHGKVHFCSSLLAAELTITLIYNGREVPYR